MMKKQRDFLLIMCLCVFTVFSAYATIKRTSDTAFGPGVFSSRYGLFYLAADSSVSTTTNALMNAQAVDNTITFSNLAHEKVRLNTSKGDADPVTSPLFEKHISQVSLHGILPVGVISSDDEFGDNQRMFFLKSFDHVLTNTELLKDAAGSDGNGIVSIEGTSNQIFAAVKPHGGSWGGENSGITLVLPDTDLRPVDAQTGEKHKNKATELDLSAGAGSTFAFGIAGELDSDVVDTYWDSTINRLFLALRIHRSDTGTNGGAVSIGVARIDSSDENKPYKISLQPIVDAKSGNFTAGAATFIVGFNANDATDYYASAYKVRTMHASTGKSYVIVNGGVSTSAVKNKIFALPIVNSGSDGNIGRLAKKTDTDSVVASASDMPLSSEEATIVGGGNLPTQSSEDVKEMFVVGDAVYVCTIGSATSDTPARQGMFHSMILFDTNGRATGWTPWRRVMGSTDKCFLGGFTTGQALFYHITNNETVSQADTMKVTQWGKGDANGLLGGTSTNGSVGLVSLLGDEFTSGNGGVFGLFDFDDSVPTFKAQGTSNGLSMMVATGYKKVALIETGRHDGTTLTPNTGDFSSNTSKTTNGSASDGAASTRAMVISGGVLNTLGPLVSADISRAAKAAGEAKGWLFVAGPNGVAVLSEDANGDGWDTETGLQRGFVGINSTMSFRAVGSFSNVVKVVADDTNLYVLTLTSLVRIPLDAGNFDGTTPSSTTLATASSITGDAGAIFYDFVVSSKLGLLATSNGLYRNANSSTIVSGAAPSWTEVKVSYASESFSLGPVSTIAVHSNAEGGFSTGGNVHVTAANLGRHYANIIRFNIADTSATAIDNDTVTHITESTGFPHYFSIGTFWPMWYTDGSMGFYQLPKNFGETDFLRRVPIGTNPTNVLRTDSISFSPGSGAINTAPMVRNFASGAWMVPGTWGIRVSE